MPDFQLPFQLAQVCSGYISGREPLLSMWIDSKKGKKTKKRKKNYRYGCREIGAHVGNFFVGIFACGMMDPYRKTL